MALRFAGGGALDAGKSRGKLLRAVKHTRWWWRRVGVLRMKQMLTVVVRSPEVEVSLLERALHAGEGRVAVKVVALRLLQVG